MRIIRKLFIMVDHPVNLYKYNVEKLYLPYFCYVACNAIACTEAHG